jgi:glycogen debranching enzyme
LKTNKTIFFHPKGNKLRLNPLFVHRDYHSLYHQNPRSDYYVERSAGRLKIYAHYGAEPLYVQFSAGSFVENRAWYNRFTYRQEQQRGLDFQEDAYSIGYIEHKLAPGTELFLMFSTGSPAAENLLIEAEPIALRTAETARVLALKNSHANPTEQPD